MFKEGKPMKAKKGKAAIANASKKMGVAALSSKKPKSAMKPGKGKAVVANGSGKKGIGSLKAKNPEKKAPKSKQAIAHAKRAVKIANYKF